MRQIRQLGNLLFDPTVVHDVGSGKVVGRTLHVTGNRHLGAIARDRHMKRFLVRDTEGHVTEGRTTIAASKITIVAILTDDVGVTSQVTSRSFTSQSPRHVSNESASLRTLARHPLRPGL